MTTIVGLGLTRPRSLELHLGLHPGGRVAVASQIAQQQDAELAVEHSGPKLVL